MLYATSSSATGDQSRAKPRWARHGRSGRQAMVAAQIHANAYSGSVGSPTVTQKTVKATAQIVMPTIRRPFLRRLVCLRGVATRSGWGDDIVLQGNDRGAPPRRRHTADPAPVVIPLHRRLSQVLPTRLRTRL